MSLLKIFLLFVICDDKIDLEVTALEINVGECLFTGGERGNWQVVKCGGMPVLWTEDRSQIPIAFGTKVMGREFQVE